MFSLTRGDLGMSVEIGGFYKALEGALQRPNNSNDAIFIGRCVLIAIRRRNTSHGYCCRYRCPVARHRAECQGIAKLISTEAQASQPMLDNK